MSHILCLQSSPPPQTFFLLQRLSLVRAELTELLTLAAHANSRLHWHYVGYRCRRSSIAIARLMQHVLWPAACNMCAPSGMVQTQGRA